MAVPGPSSRRFWEDPGARAHGLVARARRRAGAALIDNMFRGLSLVGRLHPDARPRRHRVEVLRDVAYADSGAPEHRLDVYRPTDGAGPWPVVLYLHGGGFRILSKDSHWLMGLAFARQGYLVLNASYRLAPRNPYPAALQDACAAWRWALDNAARYGGDLGTVVVAGESAGANLALSLLLCTAMERSEPWARAVFERGRVPDACLPACGIFQVSDTLRYARDNPRLSPFVLDRLIEVTHAYLGEAGQQIDPAHALADPLLLLEREPELKRPLPPIFLPVGTRDPLAEDTRRLHRALEELGVHAEARYYPGELHAFHALVWRPNARRCWRDTFAFLDRALAGR